MILLVINDTAANAALDALARRLADMTRPMQDLGDELVRWTKFRFETGAAPDGSPWAAKSEVTKEAYRRRRERVDDRPLFGPSGDLSRTIFSTALPRSFRQRPGPDRERRPRPGGCLHRCRDPGGAARGGADARATSPCTWPIPRHRGTDQQLRHPRSDRDHRDAAH